MRMKLLIALCILGCTALAPGFGVSARADDAAALLYEEDGSAQGRQGAGSVHWYKESGVAVESRIADLTARADVDIPGRSFGLALAISRNGDGAISASHLIVLAF